MKKEFTNEQIEAMEEKGGKRWIKGDYDRMYVNSEFIGFEYKLSRCGQFVVNHNLGKDVSHATGTRLKTDLNRAYIDLNNGDIVCENNSGYCYSMISDVIDEIKEKYPNNAEAEQEEEPVEYEEITVPYRVYKERLDGTLKKENSYDYCTKTIAVLVDKRNTERIKAVYDAIEEDAKEQEELRIAYEQERERKRLEKIKKEKAEEERIAPLIVAIKYKDYKNEKWDSKIEKTIYNSYDSKNRTIKAVARTPEIKAEIEAYYAEKKKHEMPQEVKDFKNGLVDEYEIIPETIDADNLTVEIPEELKNAMGVV